MKKLLYIATILLPFTTFAEATCTSNGQVVPCSGWMAVFGIGVFGLMALIIIVGILATIFWIWMLIDCLSHHQENQALWAVVIIFTGVKAIFRC